MENCLKSLINNTPVLSTKGDTLTRILYALLVTQFDMVNKIKLIILKDF